MMARRTTTASSRKDELTKLNEVDENRRQDDSNNNDISKETGDDGHDEVVKDSQWDDECAVFILKQTLFSRCLLFIIQLIFNAIVTDFPTDAFKGTPVPEGSITFTNIESFH
ncbi:unnamed protein product [Anisakis simplex]|uniref:Autophagy-related protein n=1 Tax=Anisakis simplex TaxID=6269 RepID=A0A0M3J8X6_ANISI|nr:unnamed protein product [Anisakis simplex]